MGKIAFLLSGQGAQHPGMAKDFYERFDSVKNLFDQAESVRSGTLQQMFDGTEDELKQTQNTQPCLYLADYAAALAAKECGLVADCVAGFSLGEIPALAFGGAFDALTGFRIACARGTYMAEASVKNPASMVAVVKLPNQTVEQLCGQFEQVYPVNYNCPGQLVVSGNPEELDRFSGLVKEAGGRALPLKVGGGFHSPFMSAAVEPYRQALQTFEISKPAMSVYSNFTGDLYTEDVVATLAAQVDHPVRWETVLRKMADRGVDTFIETGVGHVLQGLVKKTLPDCRSFVVEDTDTLEQVCKEVLSC